MKKTKSLLLIGMAMLVAGVFSACGGSDSSSSIVSDAVKAAEEAVALETSPVLGQIPSLQAQYKEAGKQLKEQFKAKGEELEQKFKDGGSMEDLIRENTKLEDVRRAAEAELKQIYKEKIATEANKVAQQAVKVTYDESQYSAANAKLVASADSSIAYPVNIEVVLTLAAPPFSRGYTANCCWEYQNKAGEKLDEGALPINDFKSLQAGDKITKTISPALGGTEKEIAFDHIYFKKAD